jgi:L-ribulose-5-phosphate 4-epimerase
MLEDLKVAVCRANLDLVRHRLITLTWGNASGIDRESGLVAIKPSGVSYDEMEAADMVLVDLEGSVVEGALVPSSDTPTHLALYRAWPQAGGIVHTHSTHATAFAQARRSIPCLGTTHADHFNGDVPVTRPLTLDEVKDDYEKNTGAVIVERFGDLDPEAVPGALVANHGPFAWGRDVGDAVQNAVALEAVAEMAACTWRIEPTAGPIPQYMLDKHYRRKHGPGAYYGQKEQEE